VPSTGWLRTAWEIDPGEVAVARQQAGLDWRSL